MVKMTEYALIKDDIFEKIQNFDQRPPNLPQKNIIWLPVEYDVPSFDEKYQTLSDFKSRIELEKYVLYKEVLPLSKEKLIEKIVEERTRRLELGFNYTFDDNRGTHKIGTTEQDLKGWDEVTKAAIAINYLNLPDTLNIVTDTGPVTITAIEWMEILNKATQIRQPIWAASFLLQTMESIPVDYTDDKWWS